ncbi:uncharacterized protein GGS22DRAFT_150784 [Annulohypoxylon maeteangense]|uniref:uncharacterized protein n=1 Tax=Annulohypoxylon maeteangense TaxID=1927788 RepID=UPI002008AB9D|nr:uncharacterized protein GGS22DRAFT_150784 [Annulohypoxylon maeteangense]KAI0890394.1 hypothetical protein GGS22DRAFT_150784 [Annulohypoxylon maeteangense]
MRRLHLRVSLTEIIQTIVTTQMMPATMQFIIVIFLSLVSHIVAFQAEAAGVDYSTSANISQYSQLIPLANGTTFSKNTTGDDLYHDNWQYEGTDECKWALNYIPYVSSECTEYCEADTYGWGYRFHRLRFHIKLSGNGQEPANWCAMFKARMMYNCAVGAPDFFHCNFGRAPELPSLRTWAADSSTGQVVQKEGLNLRFDFSPAWNPRDAEHDCVRTAIREATCGGTIFRNGLHCIPTMYLAPDGATEFDEGYVPPASRCLFNSEVPPEAT